jgi:FMN phosphatase YigB (HAD superfamily)
MTITTVGIDADDTLWHNETVFRLTQARFADLLKPWADEDHLLERLAAMERKNLQFYGYGIKGFTLSMLETALELTGGDIPAAVTREVLAAGREMLSHPVEPLPGVEGALTALAARWRLVLITDLLFTLTGALGVIITGHLMAARYGGADSHSWINWSYMLFRNRRETCCISLLVFL